MLGKVFPNVKCVGNCLAGKNASFPIHECSGDNSSKQHYHENNFYMAHLLQASLRLTTDQWNIPLNVARISRKAKSFYVSGLQRTHEAQR